VPNKPKTQHRSVRVDDPDWNDLGTATKHMDSDRAKALNQFIHWYLRRPGARLPDRPAKDFTDTLTGEDTSKAKEAKGGE
jgi:hypothetical protein